MQYPLGSRDANGFMPYRFGASVMAGRLFSVSPLGGRYNLFIGETVPKTSSVPDGYAPKGAFTLPIKAGGLSSWQSKVSLNGSGELLQGGPMEGTASLTFAVSPGSLGLTVGMSGTANISLTGTSGLALTIGMAGNGAITLAGGGSLALIVPVAGSGSFSVTGSGNLKGNLGMVGSWSPFTELSPQNLANAVWEQLNDNGVAYGTVVTNTEKNAKLAVALSA